MECGKSIVSPHRRWLWGARVSKSPSGYASKAEIGDHQNCSKRTTALSVHACSIMNEKALGKSQDPAVVVASFPLGERTDGDEISEVVFALCSDIASSGLNKRNARSMLGSGCVFGIRPVDQCHQMSEQQADELQMIGLHHVMHYFEQVPYQCRPIEC